jgi:hypothetical protein
MIELNLKRIVGMALVVVLQGQAGAFNSEEHKLIGDIGASRVNIPDNILSAHVRHEGIDKDHYLHFLKKAKLFATGVIDNSDPFDPSNPIMPPGTLDNCYHSSSTFAQHKYNIGIHIPTIDDIPNKTLVLEANTGSTNKDFTLGELVALYGDYRRTTSCNANGECFLTPKDISTVQFVEGNSYNGIQRNEFCPSTMDSSTYLKYIASGVVPPHGAFGNGFSNTTMDDSVNEAAWWGDEMMRIANVNDWHFSTVNLAHYIGAHRMALFYVNKARADARYWNTALHYEANALHSLTDFFALGHVVPNRDQTSYGVLKKNYQLNHPTVQWQSSIESLGGGTRTAGGIMLLSKNLPPLTDTVGPRDDFLNSYFYTDLTLALAGNSERLMHDSYNEQGATVRNLNGDEFKIYGDGKLKDLGDSDKEVIYEAVKHSLQSLFDAYNALSVYPYSTATIGSGGSYFKALEYIPILIVADDMHKISGEWILDAKEIEGITGSKLIPKTYKDCEIPYIDGRTSPNLNSRECHLLAQTYSVPFEINGRWLATPGKNDYTNTSNHTYKFKLKKESEINISLNIIGSDDDFNRYLYLLDSNGNVLEGNLNGDIQGTLPAGDYAVIATSWFERKAGDYHLRIDERKIEVFDHANYGGDRHAIYASTFNSDYEFKDNAASSVKVTCGYEATLYDGASHNGTNTVVSGDVSYLGSVSFNDKTSSIKISPRPMVKLYSGVNFGGSYIELPPGEYSKQNLLERGMRDNRIRSIRNPSDYKISFYSDGDFDGYTFSTNKEIFNSIRTRKTYSLKDNISSIKIGCGTNNRNHDELSFSPVDTSTAVTYTAENSQLLMNGFPLGIYSNANSSSQPHGETADKYCASKGHGSSLVSLLNPVQGGVLTYLKDDNTWSTTGMSQIQLFESIQCGHEIGSYHFDDSTSFKYGYPLGVLPVGPYAAQNEQETAQKFCIDEGFNGMLSSSLRAPASGVLSFLTGSNNWSVTGTSTFQLFDSIHCGNHSLI